MTLPAPTFTVRPSPARRVVLRRRIRRLVAATISYNVVEAGVALAAGAATRVARRATPVAPDRPIVHDRAGLLRWRRAVYPTEGATMSHDHEDGVTATGRHRGALAGALAAAVAIFVVEVVGAYVSGSLALLADAGHVLADAGGVALALGAAILAGRPATGRRTFGWARAEILAAALNGLVLAGIGVFVFVEGIRRLIEPADVHPGQMAAFAMVGLVGNLVGVGLLYRSRHASLNLRGAFLEVAADTATSLGVLVAAGIIALTGFTRADPLISMAIGLVIAPRALRLLRDAGHVLLEATPENLDLDDVRRHIRELDHVRDVHDLHAYTVTSGLPVLTAHVVIDDECFRDGHAPQMLDAVQSCLAGHFDVEHSTIQLEPAGHTDHERPAHD